MFRITIATGVGVVWEDVKASSYVEAFKEAAERLSLMDRGIIRWVKVEEVSR
jgi:hypothetical protein